MTEQKMWLRISVIVMELKLAGVASICEYVRTCDDRKRPSAGSNNHILCNSHALLVSGQCVSHQLVQKDFQLSAACVVSRYFASSFPQACGGSGHASGDIWQRSWCLLCFFCHVQGTASQS